MKDFLRIFPNLRTVSLVAALSVVGLVVLVINTLALDEQRQELDKWELALDLERTALEKDKREYKEFLAEREVLAKEIMKYSAELFKMKEELALEEKARNAAAEEYKTHKRRTDELEQSAKAAEERLKKAQTDEKYLTPAIRDLNERKSQLDASVAALQKRQDELQERKTRLEQEADAQSKALNDLKAELGRLQGQLEARQTAISELDKENAAFDRLSKSMAELVEKLGSDGKNAGQLVADMKKTLEEIRAQNAALAELSGGDLARAAASMKTQAEELGNDRGDVKKASESLNAATTSLELLASSLEAQKARIDESLKSLEKVYGLVGDNDQGLARTRNLLAQVNAQLGDLLAAMERESSAADRANGTETEEAPERPAGDENAR